VPAERLMLVFIGTLQSVTARQTSISPCSEESSVALLDDLFKTDPVTGIVVGIGVVLLGPTILPVAGQAVRPMVKAVIKGGMVLYDQIAELGEATSELVAEAQADLALEPVPSAAVNPDQPPRRRPRGRSSKRPQKP